MEEERKIFRDAYKVLEDFYEDPNWEELAKRIPVLNAKYNGSKLFSNLLLAVLDHLENKRQWEENQMNLFNE